MKQFLSGVLVLLGVVGFALAGTSLNYLDGKSENFNLNLGKQFDTSFYLEMSCPNKTPLDRRIVASFSIIINLLCS